MNCAILTTDGIVANTIIVDDATHARIFGGIELPEGYGIGDLFDGEKWLHSYEIPVPLEQARTRKLAEISDVCHAAIVAGVDVGGKHYGLDEHDQINILGLTLAIASGQATVSYHADGELCREYSAEEFMAVSAAATAHKTAALTKHNALKFQIETAENIEEVEAVIW